jgi:hypothetical protein
LIAILQNKIIEPFIVVNPNAAIKMVCSAIETCANYMTKTNKTSEFNESLEFLVRVKRESIKMGPIAIILEHEMNEIMRNFHSGFKYLKNEENCKKVLETYAEVGNLNRVLTEFYNEARYNKSPTINTDQSEHGENTPNSMYKEKQQYKEKVHQCKPVVQEKLERMLSEPEAEDSLKEPEINDTETNSSVKSQEKKPETKKMKVIGRSKFGKRNLEKVEITIK